MDKLHFFLLILALGIFSINMMFVSNAYAQTMMSSTTIQVEQAAVVEFFTYWEPNLQINNRISIETESGKIPVEFFSQKYKPRSGGAGSFRIIGSRSIGLHLGGEWTASRARVYWHSPELGISFPEMESELKMLDLWLGVLYAPFLLNQFPVRPHINLDAGWMQTTFVLRSKGKLVDSGPKLRESHVLLRYGLGLDIAIIWGVGVTLKHQRYFLKHSQFEPEKGIILEGDHSNPYLLSFGLFIGI